MSGNPGEPAGRSSAAAEHATPGEVYAVPVIQRRFENVLEASRLIIVIPVVFLLVDAAGSFAYGCLIFITTLSDVARETETEKIGGILGRFLVVMDSYLVGATLMIAAYGFYSLFIGGKPSGSRFRLPSWLTMRDLEDLKARVVSMLILVAAITFVDVAVETHDEIGVFYLGIGIAVVIVALTAFLRFGRQMHAPAISGGAPGGDGRRVSQPPGDGAGHQGQLARPGR